MDVFVWIIIITIIFGIIGRMANKFKESAQQRPQAGAGDPSFSHTEGTAQVRHTGHKNSDEPDPSFRDKEIHRYGRDHSTASKGDEEGGASPYRQDNKAPYATKQETPYERENQHPYQREQEAPYQNEHGKKDNVPDFSRLTQEQWKERIIFSEVLGPPRARNPHHAGRYDRNMKS